MPSFMGLVLLMGIVVNNGILLNDFARVAPAEGKDLRTALLDAVEKRTRAILMTAASLATGMPRSRLNGRSASSACRRWPWLSLAR